MNKRWRRNSDNRRVARVLLLVVGILLLGWLLPRAVALVGMVALYPVHAVQQWFDQSSMVVPALWRDKVALQQRVNELEAQQAVQPPADVTRRRLQEENNQLRQLLGATTSHRVAAAVVARPAQLPYDVLQIDQGSQAGITLHAPVYANREEVVGFVSRVYPHTALVTLLTTPGLSVTGYVAGSNILATVEGMGGGVARVAVPQGIVLQPDSLVYVPSVQPGVLGRIVEIESEPTGAQQFGYIVPSWPLQHVRYVSVGRTTDVHTDEVSVGAYIDTIQQQLALPDTFAVPSTTPATTSPASTTATSTSPVTSLVP